MDNSRKLGLTSNRLAPPPTAVNARGIEGASESSHAPIQSSHGNLLQSANNSVAVSAVGQADSSQTRTRDALAKQYPPMGGAHHPISCSAATCVSNRQRIQAEFHERTKEHMASFFAQRSLEADRLPSDQARCRVTVACFVIEALVSLKASTSQDARASRTAREADHEGSAGSCHTAALHVGHVGKAVRGGRRGCVHDMN